jgi:uncharacterized membrane protein
VRCDHRVRSGGDEGTDGQQAVTAGVFGVVVFVTSLTSHDGWVTAVVVGLIASLLWLVLFPWVFRIRR